MTILANDREQLEYWTRIRRHLHQHPEIGFEEVETTALIKRELEKIGVEICPLAIDTGVMAIIRGTKPGQGKTIALRADIDALPIQEQTGLPMPRFGKVFAAMMVTPPCYWAQPNNSLKCGISFPASSSCCFSRRASLAQPAVQLS